MYIISWSRGRPENNGSPGFIRQIQVSAYKICMKMCFKNIFDRSPVAVGFINIGLGFTKGINDGGFPIAFNVIRGFCEAAGIDFFIFYCFFI